MAVARDLPLEQRCLGASNTQPVVYQSCISETVGGAYIGCLQRLAGWERSATHTCTTIACGPPWPAGATTRRCQTVCCTRACRKYRCSCTARRARRAAWCPPWMQHWASNTSAAGSGAAEVPSGGCQMITVKFEAVSSVKCAGIQRAMHPYKAWWPASTLHHCLHRGELTVYCACK